MITKQLFHSTVNTTRKAKSNKFVLKNVQENAVNFITTETKMTSLPFRFIAKKIEVDISAWWGRCDRPWQLTVHSEWTLRSKRGLPVKKVRSSRCGGWWCRRCLADVFLVEGVEAGEDAGLRASVARVRVIVEGVAPSTGRGRERNCTRVPSRSSIRRPVYDDDNCFSKNIFCKQTWPFRKGNFLVYIYADNRHDQTPSHSSYVIFFKNIEQINNKVCIE